MAPILLIFLRINWPQRMYCVLSNHQNNSSPSYYHYFYGDLDELRRNISDWPKSGPVETRPTGPVATPLHCYKGRNLCPLLDIALLTWVELLIRSAWQCQSGSSLTWGNDTAAHYYTMRPSITSAGEQLDPRSAASRHITAPISHTRPSPRSP